MKPTFTPFTIKHEPSLRVRLVAFAAWPFIVVALALLWPATLFRFAYRQET
jgi:hypothetical protein